MKIFQLILVLGLFPGRAFALSSTESVHLSTPPVQRGAEIYRRMCSVCHGPKGEGYKADQAPALSNADYLSSASDDFIRIAIAQGRAGTTMSAWSSERGGPLGGEDISAVIAFLRTWNARPSVDLNDKPALGSASRGAGIYAGKCAQCHGPRGLGGQYINIGNPRFLESASNGYLRHAIRLGREKTPMSGFGESLGDERIEDVLSFIKTWQSTAAAQVPRLEAPPPMAPLSLGPVLLNPNGPDPIGFLYFPAYTPADVIKAQLDLNAKMAILDARAPTDYINEHIAGAVSVPFYDPIPYLSALPKDSWLVSYCACPHAESGELAQKLLKNGFKKTAVLDEGLRFWKLRGYPTRAGQLP